ncbi:hypothetical protein [Streptomyces sp. CoH17]|uniref:hypothetical protein n=1 Tax=Streptomyces sp. CoH17 TaxID=2992806 RepID=UPI0022705D25|nr:hypothetical protein [Streptomyces sp. CoH17]
MSENPIKDLYESDKTTDELLEFAGESLDDEDQTILDLAAKTSSEGTKGETFRVILCAKLVESGYTLMDID